MANCVYTLLILLEYSPTYPGLLVVPSTISDNVLRYGGSYRSKTRIPALTYLHSVNNCSITRSAQPLVGMFQGKRNAQDERLVAAIFATSTPAPATSGAAADAASLSAVVSEAREAETGSAPEVDLASSQDSISLSIGSDENAFPQSFGEPDVTTAQPLPPKIYGAQQRNFIVDARPQINAVANQATGMGSENMEYYKDATKEFLGIANIHVMRDSLNKVVEAFANSDYTNFPPSQDILAKSKWLDYITILLRGADLVARQVGVHHSHVLIHCSDGWDRTSQIAALSELCLDPYYRTMEGFIVLVEKDFLSFGHMFRHRSGFLSSEKWFEVENERISGGAKGKEQDAAAAGANGGSNAFENALFAARGFFNQKKNDSRESLHIDPADAAPSGLSSVNKHATKVKETSPIFHQFLDATYQLLYQHPDRFEFTERFLRRLLYQLYACQYGTFLYDSERERVEAHVAERTRSVWDHFLSRREQFTNPSYDGTIDDKVPGKERLLFPDMRKVRWWPEVFGRTDEEMNGSVHAPAASLPKENGALREPLIRGIENSEMSIGPAANGSSTGASSPLPSQLQNNIGASAFANGAEKLSTSLANLGFGVRSTAASSASNSRSRTPPGAKTEQQASVVDSAIDSSGRAAMSPPRREDMFSAFARDNAFRDS